MEAFDRQRGEFIRATLWGMVGSAASLGRVEDDNWIIEENEVIEEEKEKIGRWEKIKEEESEDEE